jgi:hypothetical protein
MTIVLTSQSTFNKTLILKNTAYDIALTLRNAETYGLGSRASGAVANTGYGVHFSRISPREFILFADTSPSTPSATNCHGLPLFGGQSAPDALPGDCIYTGGSDRKVITYTLGNGIFVSNLCVGGGACGFTSLDIVFSRPNPDTFVRADGNANTEYNSACIIVSSPQGGPSRYITISSSGAITADAASCQQ